MSESTNTQRPDPEARRGVMTPAVEHGITIEIADLPANEPRMRAACVCGWTSNLAPTPALAEARGAAHEIREATAHAREVRERIEAGHAGGKLPQAMRYPATDAHGRTIDLFVGNGEPDPFFDECPTWCEVQGTHTAEGSDGDRSHWGQIYSVPVRSVDAEYQPLDSPDGPGQVTGRATVYLCRKVLHKDPVIFIGKNDHAGTHLTLSEAEDIATLLQQLVRAAEAGR